MLRIFIIITVQTLNLDSGRLVGDFIPSALSHPLIPPQHHRHHHHHEPHPRHEPLPFRPSNTGVIRAKRQQKRCIRIFTKKTPLARFTKMSPSEELGTLMKIFMELEFDQQHHHDDLSPLWPPPLTNSPLHLRHDRVGGLPGCSNAIIITIINTIITITIINITIITITITITIIITFLV